MSILNEEIYGNIATVYHRSKTEPEKFCSFLENGEWESGSGAGNMYGPGLYTVFSIESNNKNYGDYLYKLHVKGIKNFFIFLPEIYNKVWGTNKSYEEMIYEQNKRFNSNFKKYTDFINSYSKEHSKVAGIVFHGNHDGDVCIIFEPRNVIPISYKGPNMNSFKKLNMSIKYKKNAFLKAGEIIDYLKKDNQLLNSLLEDKEFKRIKDPNSFYNKRIQPFYYRRFKKNISLSKVESIIKTLSPRASLKQNKYFDKKIFDSKSFAVYDKNKNLVDVIYFNGRKFLSGYNNYYDEDCYNLAKYIFGNEEAKHADKTTERKIQQESFKKVQLGDAHLNATNKSEIIKHIQIPSEIKKYIKILNINVNKNVYDVSNKVSGSILIGFDFLDSNGNKLKGTEKKNAVEEMARKINVDIKQFIKIFNILTNNFEINLMTNKIRPVDNSGDFNFNIPKKIGEFLEDKISKTNFLINIKNTIVKRIFSYKKVKSNSLNNKVNSVDYFGDRTMIAVGRNKYTNMRAKIERDKEEREENGKYIGKHLYDNYSVNAYFNY